MVGHRQRCLVVVAVVAPARVQVEVLPLATPARVPVAVVVRNETSGCQAYRRGRLRSSHRPFRPVCYVPSPNPGSWIPRGHNKNAHDLDCGVNGNEEDAQMNLNQDYIELKCPDCKHRWSIQVAPGYAGWITCPACGLMDSIKAFAKKWLHAGEYSIR